MFLSRIDNSSSKPNHDDSYVNEIIASTQTAHNKFTTIIFEQRQSKLYAAVAHNEQQPMLIQTPV